MEMILFLKVRGEKFSTIERRSVDVDSDLGGLVSSHFYLAPQKMECAFHGREITLFQPLL